MWRREDLKSYAKKFISKDFWKVFLISVLSPGLIGSGKRFNPFGLHYIMIIIFFNSLQSLNILIALLIILIVLKPIYYALEVGAARFFLRGFQGDIWVGYIFSTFNLKEYFNIAKTMYLRDLFLLLWTIFLIVPGVIKHYDYRMIPYILSENPNLGGKEAIRISRNITKDHKMNMFILDISFIGWYYLTWLLIPLATPLIFIFGFGFLIMLSIRILPDTYYEATFARLYNIISVENNIITD